MLSESLQNEAGHAENLADSSLVKNKESNSFVRERKACKLSIADF
jgi:hypothetical protein